MRLFGSGDSAGMDAIDDVPNPGRGFYELHPYDLNVEPVWDDIRWCVKADQSLVLLMLDIHAFKDGDIDQAALVRADRLLKIYGELGKDLIVRIVYDREGRGLENEPGLMSIVMRHMEQLGPVLNENSRYVYVAQGLFVGDWGEMHGSKFLREDRLVQLYEAWSRATGGMRVAVRTPSQLRSICRGVLSHTGAVNVIGGAVNVRDGAVNVVGGAGGAADGLAGEGILANLGLYNDGILGSWTDLGTYCAGRGAWDREAELDFQDRLCLTETNGGEVAGWQGEAGEKPDAATVIAVMRKMHLSYLNSQHDLKVLDEWKDIPCGVRGGWQDRSLYDYVRAHLGYRFVVTGAVWDAGNSKLYLDIANEGFANLYDEVAAAAVWCDGAEHGILQGSVAVGKIGKAALSMGKDLRQLAPGSSMRMEIPVIQENGGNGNGLKLVVTRKKDGRNIEVVTLND
jgi:hypothetical protein